MRNPVPFSHGKQASAGIWQFGIARPQSTQWSVHRLTPLAAKATGELFETY